MTLGSLLSTFFKWYGIVSAILLVPVGIPFMITDSGLIGLFIVEFILVGIVGGCVRNCIKYSLERRSRPSR